MELVRTVASDVLARHLADWMWLPELEGLAPFAVTAFGDVFLSSDDGVWFLDTIEGRVERKWDDRDALRAELDTEEGRSTYLLDGLVDGAVRHGVAPGPDQVLSFTVPPVLGGPLEVENVSALDLAVALSVTGQLHRQVKDLPPGTPVSGVSISHPTSDDG